MNDDDDIVVVVTKQPGAVQNLSPCCCHLVVVTLLFGSCAIPDVGQADRLETLMPSENGPQTIGNR